ncbi:hypothetical protein HWV62_9845 [Athelia sp. TMB]|nr:hypothetical protein HWV62_9845 [Athelia sp. TMB]
MGSTAQTPLTTGDVPRFEANCPTGVIGPYDAMVLHHRPPWVLTSPNLTELPFIDLGYSELRARADGRWGSEDYTRVPQVYSESYPWLPCVPRRPPDINNSPHWVLWADVRTSDHVPFPGSAFGFTGILDESLHAILSRKLQEIHQITMDGVPGGGMKPCMVAAADAMLATVRRLRALPMSYRDLVLQWTQAQRLALDLLAMRAYYEHISKRMLQRDEVWPLAHDMMGCFTMSPTIAENMFYAGIPVTFLRNDLHVPPSSIRVRRIATTATVLPPHVVTTHWTDKLCVCFDNGPSSSWRVQMSRPHGRYFEDLPALPRPAAQEPNVDPFLPRAPSLPTSTAHVAQASTPQHDDVSSLVVTTRMRAPPAQPLPPALVAICAGESPTSTTLSAAKTSSVTVRTRVLAGRVTKSPATKLSVQPGSRRDRLRAIRAHPQFMSNPPPPKPSLPKPTNRDKWILAVGGIMPPQCLAWSAAKQRVNRQVKVTECIPKERAGLMYPDPSYINAIQPANRAAAMAAWLSIRGARCGQMAYPDLQDMPVASTATWRHFFGLWRRRPNDVLGMDASPFNVEDRRAHDAAMEAARSMFGPEMLAMMNDTFSQVFWNGKAFDIIDGAVVAMESDTYQQIAWELMELNWRYEVMALDRVLAPAKWKDQESSDSRVQQVLQVFAPFSSFTLLDGPFPSQVPFAAADTVAARLPALKALRQLMTSWRGCSGRILFCPLYEPPDAESPEARLLEEHTMEYYCQTFYDNFRRPPFLPAGLPA